MGVQSIAKSSGSRHGARRILLMGYFVLLSENDKIKRIQNGRGAESLSGDLGEKAIWFVIGETQSKLI